MRIPKDLCHILEKTFEADLEAFCHEQALIADDARLGSRRFLSRSVLPHLQKLSEAYNRKEGQTPPSLSTDGLRLAYFLGFMPANLFRMASVFSELSRLGFRWNNTSPLQAVDFGSGFSSSFCGMLLNETISPIGLPVGGSVALVEQSKLVLQAGKNWADWFAQKKGVQDYQIRPFQRRLDIHQALLPPRSPRFDLWMMSFFLNEAIADESSRDDLAEFARALTKTWKDHLEEGGLVVIVEPALKAQSRKLLELRKALLAQKVFQSGAMQVLLPCLGNQSCDALADPDDWCHEQVEFWRPDYLRLLDELSGLDHKELPFSYLVLVKSRRSRTELLPKLEEAKDPSLCRIVSPVFKSGSHQECYLCGSTGKHRVWLPQKTDLQRGDFIPRSRVRILNPGS